MNATVNSNVEIEYESSDYSVASIEGNVLTIVGAGQCYITASAAGNKNYYTANPVERTLIVAQAQPTLTFAPLENEYTYGDAPIELVANCNAGQVTFTSSNLAKLLIVGTNAMIQGSGHFTITASFAGNANYQPVSAEQEITVNKAALTVTANNETRGYGEANPNFSYKITGFVNGDTKLDLTSTIQVSSNATMASSVGTYEIVPTATVDDNYIITCKKGVLTIEQAPLTISANAIREYGENNPEFDFTYTGFRNEESSSVLSSLPQAYTTAKRTSSAGTYPVYVSGAAAQNYAISYEQGALIITKAPLTIRALDATRNRLEENPTFELSISGYKLEETVDVLDKLPTIQCEADVNSPAGTYPIVLLNDGYATNYEYILINGTLTVKKLQFTITVQSEDESMGTVSGGGTYDEEETVNIYAIPRAHHHFVRWDDGNQDVMRSVVVSQNASYTASFAIDKHTITTSVNDGTKGFVSGAGEYDYGTTIELTAVPYEGYQFNRWSDGNTQNPRTVEVVDNASYTAEFGIKQCVVTLKTSDYIMGRVSGGGTYNYGTYIELKAIPNSGYKFSHWSNGETYNPYTMVIQDNLNLVAYFEDESLDDAEQTDVLFDEDATLDSVIINTTASTAQFIWPVIDGATLYSLVIWADEARTIKVCTLTFNTSGQLVNIDFSQNAPMRMRNQAASADNMQNVALAFTVTGLSPNAKYGFDMDAKNSQAETLDMTQGSFETNNSEDIDTVNGQQSTTKVQKVLINNQVFILRGDKTYTLQGQEVK